MPETRFSGYILSKYRLRSTYTCKRTYEWDTDAADSDRPLLDVRYLDAQSGAVASVMVTVHFFNFSKTKGVRGCLAEMLRVVITCLPMRDENDITRY